MGHAAVKVSKGHPVVKKLLALAHPSYKGRKVSVELAEKCHCDPIGGGGSKDLVVAVSLSGEKMAIAPSPFSGEYAKCVYEGLLVPEGVALVVHSYFCGKDMGIRIYIAPSSVKALNASEVAGLLPAAEVL